MSSPPTSNCPISSFKSPFPPLPPPLVISPQQFWEKFADDINADHDAPSLPDLPPRSQHHPQNERKPPDAFQDFEFLTCDSGRFLHVDQGQLRPLPPSLNSTITSGTTSNSNCSSASVSRSQSSNSSDHSSNSVLPRLSVSNRFYAHPSPKPQVRNSVVSGRKSTGSAPRGWGLFRVGVVKVPEIEINNLRSRLNKSSDKKCVEAKEKSESRFGFGCKCEPDVSEPVRLPTTARGEKGKKSDKSSRVIKWLEEVSVGTNGSNIGLKFV